MARVDVIIPTRNRDAFTREAIASVTAQTFTDLRIIVVDDHSDDGSAAALASLADGDPRITFIANHRARGPQCARQSGLDVSDAPLVALLDSDDLWAPGKLRAQVDRFDAEPEHVRRMTMVGCDHVWCDVSGAPVPALARRRDGLTDPADGDRLTPLRTDNMSAPLLSRALIDDAGGMLPPGGASLPAAEGIEFFVRLSRRAHLAWVHETLVRCRRHRFDGASTPLDSRAGAEGLAAVVALHDDHLRRFPRERASLHARVAARYLNAGEVRSGLRCLATALRAADPAAAALLLRRYGPLVARAAVRKGRNGTNGSSGSTNVHERNPAQR